MRAIYAVMAAMGLSAIGLVSGATAPAAAQNNFAAPQVMTDVSADQIIQLFAGAGMQGVSAGASGGDHLVELRSSEGFVMYVALSGCAGQASSAPCSLVKPYAVFNEALPLDVVNRFNYSVSNVATLMMMPDNRALLGVKILLEGGVTEANLRAYLGSYMFDAIALLEGPQEEGATNVAYRPFEAAGPSPGVVPAPAARANAMDVKAAGAARAAALMAGEKPGLAD